MSEFRLYPCNPSLLKQLARIDEARRRQRQAQAIVNGLLSAVFALALGVIAVTFAGAFSF